MKQDDVFLSLEEACRFLGGEHRPWSRSTLYRRVKEGSVPAPVKLGPGMSRWLRSELVAVRERAVQARAA